MADEQNHPLVDLMLARMKSHPEEFKSVDGRWDSAMGAIENWAKPEQKALVTRALYDILLDAAHHEAMDELFNGEERRLKLMEAEKENQLAQAQRYAAIQQQMQQAKQQLGGYGQLGQSSPTDISQLGIGRGTSTIGGRGITWAVMDEIADIQPNAIKLGGETLDEGMIKRMKKALGL